MELTNWAFLCVLLLTSAPLFGNVCTVPDQFPSIQLAINGSQEGDTVLVKQGIYEECISFAGKNIVVTSIDPTDRNVVSNTVIKGDGSGSVVSFTNGEDHRAVLTGFTITSGYGSRDPDYANSILGAGIYCYRSSPIIRRNIIADNHAPDGQKELYGYGGGICCLEASPLVTGNTIRDNSAFCGGGIFAYMGEAKIVSNMICWNKAEYGGGVTLWSGGQHVELTNNTLAGNEAKGGGNVTADGRSQIKNNIIAFGKAENGGGIFWGGGCPVKDGPIAFNNLYANAGGDYFGVVDQTGRNGNIRQDPLFAYLEPDYFQLLAESPCISGGDPANVTKDDELDVFGEPRIWGGRIDIGADEYVGYVRPICDAGQDQTFFGVPDSVTLDGNASYLHAPETSVLYEWRQVGGPQIQLNDSGNSKASFVPVLPGVYDFELTVNDGLSESRPDRVTVIVGADRLPVADAGPTQYATTGPVRLDGSGSYPAQATDNLSYRWRQISGPPMILTDTKSPTPTVHAPARLVGRIEVNTFFQTNQIQTCEFELSVSDGDLASRPALARLVILPDFGDTALEQRNPPFDPNKPTIVYFGGGDCVVGGGGQTWWRPFWASRANILNFPRGYSPDLSLDGQRTYYKCGDMILAYISSFAPEYAQPIQTMGWSTGGQPAFDTATYINLAFQDARYAVNRVTGLDIACRDYSYSRGLFNASAVGGEQCWSDFYWDNRTQPADGTFLGVRVPLGHGGVRDWYEASTGSLSEPYIFNDGVVAGAYWSVIGPGKNLQLAMTEGPSIYRFSWAGTQSDGKIGFTDESKYSGRLPEPVTLVGPEDGSLVDAGGAIFSCEESANAVRYQLLFGPDPYRVMDYHIISDSPDPPVETIVAAPFEQTWWTVKVHDRYGSTIYADPICAKFEKLNPLVENATTGQSHASIQHAIDDASDGHEIVVWPGVYVGSIILKGKNLTLRSIDPNDSAVVSQTVITASDDVITFSGGEDADCILYGITVSGGRRGIYCSGSSPTIANCAVLKNETADVGAGMYIDDNSSPTLLNCLFAGNAASLSGGGIQSVNSSPTFINCTFSRNSAAYFGGGIYCAGGSLTLTNSILWDDAPEEMCTFGDAIAVTFSDIQGGFAGEGNIEADPLFSDPDNDDYHLKSEAGRCDPLSEWWVIDGTTSPCIDSGEPSSPVGNEPEPNGGRINMGAYGGTREASKSP